MSLTVVVGLAIVSVMLLVYVASNLVRPNIYNHFVWQASAWLDGQAAIVYPVKDTPGMPDNDYFNDVQQLYNADGSATGRALLPFPPLPAAVLLPFVAVFGLATNQQLLAAILGAFDVGLMFWMLGLLRIGAGTRVAVTVFFGLGTVFWYAAEKGTTWYFAHVVAVGLTTLAIGVALGGDRRAVDEASELDGPAEGTAEAEGDAAGESWRTRAGLPDLVDVRHAARTLFSSRQFLAGVLFGLACTARLTVVFGAFFFLFIGRGGSWWRRGLSAGIGAAIPLGVLVAYNLVSTGHVFSPVYDFLYQQEAGFYTFLNYNAAWSIEDPRYLPQNLALALIGPPDILPKVLDFGRQLCTAPGATPGWLDPDCPIISPKTVGMGLLFTSPAYLLALPSLAAGYGRARLVTGAALATLFIFVVNLMHFSQGWVQFGYRFSLDFAPFALLIVALGLHRLASTRPGRAVVLGTGLIAVSIVVNLWGVYWASVFGW